MWSHGARIRAAWLLVAPYLILARPDARSLAAGAAVVGAGLTLRAWAAGSIEKEAVLATTGPYAFVRNPLYLGSFLIAIGFGLAAGHWIWPALFAVFFAGVYVPTIAREGERLRARFGARYAEYAAHVPALVPRLLPWRDPGGAERAGFRWRVWRRNREWQSLLGAGAALVVLALKVWWASR